MEAEVGIKPYAINGNNAIRSIYTDAKIYYSTNPSHRYRTLNQTGSGHKFIANPSALTAHHLHPSLSLSLSSYLPEHFKLTQYTQRLRWIAVSYTHLRK